MPISADVFLVHRQCARIVIARRARAAATRGRALAAGGASLQHRHRGVGHRQRTLRAVLDLAVQQIRGRTRDLRASALLDPGRAMLALVHRQHHQLVPRGIETDLVDAIAEAVVRPQLRSETIGARRQCEALDAAELRAPGRKVSSAHAAPSRATPSRSARSVR